MFEKSVGDAPGVSDSAEVSGMFEKSVGDAPGVSDSVISGGSHAVLARDAPGHASSAVAEMQTQIGAPTVVPGDPDDQDDPGAPARGGDANGTEAADAPALSDSARASASHIRWAGDAPSAVDAASAVPGIGDGRPGGPSQDASAPGMHMEDARDAPDAADAASYVHGSPEPPPQSDPPQSDPPQSDPPQSDPPPIVVAPATPAPPAAPSPAPAAPAPFMGGGGGGGGGPRGADGAGAPAANQGGGSRLPSIAEVAWDFCGGGSDLRIVVDDGRSTTYVAVGQDGGGGGGPSGASLSPPAATAFAVPDGAPGDGYSTTWHARVDIGAGRDLRIEARMSQGVPPPAYLNSLPLGECEVNSSSGSLCYTVADEEDVEIDSCSGARSFGNDAPPGRGGQQEPDPEDAARGGESAVSAPAEPGPAAGGAAAAASVPAEPEAEPEPTMVQFGGGGEEPILGDSLGMAAVGGLDRGGYTPARDAAEDAPPAEPASASEGGWNTQTAAYMAAAAAVAAILAAAAFALRRRGRGRGRPAVAIAPEGRR